MALFAALQLLCVRAQTLGDAQWDYRFAIAGVPDSEGMVGAMAFDGTNIYIGGSFQSAGYATCQGVARFDGQQLQALPPGPQQELPLVNVLAMEMFEGQLWVGGLFPSVAGVPSGGLARWHGTNGSVPGGATGEVYAITKDTAGLLVAGKFWLPG